MLRRADYWTLRRIRMIANYQFFAGAGSSLFPAGVDVSFSARTGKVREIRERSIHIATLNPKSGFFSLSMEGAGRLMSGHDSSIVVIKNDFVSPVSKGGNVFAKHVVEAGLGIRAGNEAIVVSEDSIPIAVGHSLLSGEEAERFKYGVAIKVRRGVSTQHGVSKNGS